MKMEMELVCKIPERLYFTINSNLDWIDKCYPSGHTFGRTENLNLSLISDFQRILQLLNGIIIWNTTSNVDLNRYVHMRVGERGSIYFDVTWGRDKWISRKVRSRFEQMSYVEK